jgi:hypothetical protein
LFQTSAFFTNAKYKRKEYKRKTEFRKLCDNLRTHLQHVTRQVPGGPNGINLQQPETQQMKLETRLDQLDKAIKMELWTEAYKVDFVLGRSYIFGFVCHVYVTVLSNI